MNIALYSHYYAPEIGAPSARYHDMTSEWIRAGDSVEVFTCVPNHPTGVVYPGYERAFHQMETLGGADVHRVWTYVTANKGFVKKSIGHVSFWPSSIIASNRHMRETPDVVIGTSPTFFAAMAAKHVGRARKRPFVMEVRDLWPALFIELGVLKSRAMIGLLEKLELSLYRDAARIVTVTESFRHDLLRRGVPEWKVATIPNGADLEFWTDRGEGKELRERIGLRDEFVVLYIGAHGISQALTSVLRSAARLRQKRGIRFVFVGEGSEKEKLVQFAARERLTGVIFVDAVGRNDVRAWYSLSDICLVPLRDIPIFGSFIPSKMFEALAMQRPVIGCLRGEAATILANSGGALIVPPEDDAALASAIVHLQQCGEEERRAMGERGRRYVAENYSRRVLANTFRGVMAEAIDEFSASHR